MADAEPPGRGDHARYPELEPIAEQLADSAVVLDGEVVALDDRGRPSFQLIQRRMGLTTAAAVRSRMAVTPVDYMVFDLLHLDGAQRARAALSERRALLDGLGLDGPRWHVPGCHRVGGGADLLEAARRQGLEGVVGKAPRQPLPARQALAGSGSRRGSGSDRSS